MGNRTPAALSVIAVTTVVTLVVYGVIRWLWIVLVADVNGDETRIGWSNVLFVTVLAGVAAWVVYILLRRSGREGWWPIIGIIALVVSLLGTLSAPDRSSTVALIVLHLVAGVLLIAGFARLDLAGERVPIGQRG